VVLRGNIAKFGKNTELGEYLKSTGNEVLVEAAHYDPVWGIGLHESDPDAQDPAKWKGQNLLGQVLMEVRALYTGYPLNAFLQAHRWVGNAPLGIDWSADEKVFFDGIGAENDSPLARRAFKFGILCAESGMGESGLRSAYLKWLQEGAA